MIDRRTFVRTVLGGLVAAPLAAEAQPAEKVWRIGMADFSPLLDIWGSVRRPLGDLPDIGSQPPCYFAVQVRRAV